GTEMCLAPLRRQQRLALALRRRGLPPGIAGATRAADAVAEIGVRAVGGGDRMAAAAAERGVADFEAVADGDAFVEDEALALPATIRLRNCLEIGENAALEVEYFLEALRQQIGRSLLAADAAGAEHRHLAVAGRIEVVGNVALEGDEAVDAGVDGAGKAAKGGFVAVAGVEQHH